MLHNRDTAGGTVCVHFAETPRPFPVLVMPFKEQRPTWRLPENGEPSRQAICVPAHRLPA